MIELPIFKLFLEDKSMYDKYYSVLNHSYIKEHYKDFSKLLSCVHNYYSRNHHATNLSYQDCEAYYLSSYPLLKDGDRTLLSSLLQRVEAAEVSDSILHYLTEHRNRSLANLIAIKAFDVAEGKAPLTDLTALYTQLEQTSVGSVSTFVTDDLEELYNEQVHIPGLRWRLKFLNQSLGSLRKGDFGFVFARPETGKTTFLASEVTHFASQTESPILWCNNEEGGNKVMLRCYQAALGITSKELFEDLAGNKAKFMSMTGGRIKIYDDASMTRRSIEDKCKELNPSLIIIDQIDKIKGFNDDRHDLMLKGIYQWARELAKVYSPVIGICQAGGTGEGKKWLTMNDVDNSHTGKQGEADFILGIGKSNEEGLGNIRYMNISKNKLLGDDDSVSSLRHARTETLIQAEVARYVDIQRRITCL